ncbi:MAG: diguanylate cyclase [Planctomycetes bacterium]|nr:diguanylate cyclase [Planctomycetota bacterium]
MDELKLTGALPSPTGVGLAILELTRGEDYAMGDVTRAIQSDPALTGRIIKIANSAGFAGSQGVTSVAQAAMRLGVRSVRNVALGFTLVSGNRGGSCPGFDYEGYWARSLAVAVLSQRLAEALRLCAPADAFTCGLLSGIGTLALASIHPDRYAQLLERKRAVPSAELLHLEREIFDLDHCELAGAMLADWRLPESFCFAVTAFERRDPYAGAPDESARRMTVIVRAASLMASWCFLGEGDSEQGPERLEELLRELRLERDAFERLRVEALGEWREWGRALQIPTDSAQKPAEIQAEAQRAIEVPSDTQVRRVAAERKGLRILAVDDDPVSLRILEHHLTKDGHTVQRAMNGRQALIMALESSPQMIVTDWNMPEMDGLELAKSLRRSNESRGTYILLLTGREEEDRVVEAFDAGVDEYVVKPFNPKILLARVRAGQRMIELREQVESDRQLRDRQVAEMAVLNRKLEAAAMTDVLTKLPNRRYAMRRLEDELNGALAAGAPLSVIMIDIDHFKQVNDRFGHDMGDLVLRETATVLRNTTRKGDYVCRLGGEEFLVICTKASLPQCAMTAERIRAAVEEHIIGFGFDRAVTVSLGAAALECGARTVDELLKLADRRVYAAKAAGRNRVCSNDAPPSQARSA